MGNCGKLQRTDIQAKVQGRDEAKEGKLPPLAPRGQRLPVEERQAANDKTGRQQTAGGNFIGR